MKSGDIFAIMHPEKFRDARKQHKVWNEKVTSGKREVEVDTAFVVDVQQFETGIKYMYWHIVERYPDEKSAGAGHKKWVKWLKDNPTADIPDPLGDAY